MIPACRRTIIAFVVFWIAHSLALQRAHVRLREHPLYAKLKYSRHLPARRHRGAFDARYLDRSALLRRPRPRRRSHCLARSGFGNPLSFYLFKIPFYSDLLGLLLGIVVLGGLIYWGAERGWELTSRIGDWRNVQGMSVTELNLAGALNSNFLRGLGAVFLISLAARFFLARYNLLLEEHGSFMVGIDYVDQYFVLPLQWVEIAGCIISAGPAACQSLALPALVAVVARHRDTQCGATHHFWRICPAE